MKYIFHFSLAFFLFLKCVSCMEVTDTTSSNTRYVYLIVPGQGDFGGTENDGNLISQKIITRKWQANQ